MKKWSETMVNKLKRKIGIMSMLLMITCMVTGCGNSSSSNKEDTVRMATMTTGFTALMHTANTDGVYDDLGLKVDEQYFDNGPTTNEAIAAGDIDVATIGAMPAITGNIANGTRVVAILADDEESVQIYARNDSDIVKAGKGNIKNHPNIYGTAKEWKGKKVVCAKGTSSHYGLLATLETLGLTEKDIELINMEGASGASAFEAGTGDIFVGFDPQWAKFYENPDKYTCVSTCADTGKKLYDVVIATDDFCENHSDQLVNILKGVLQEEKKYENDQNGYNQAMYDWQNEYGECSEKLAAYSAKIKPVISIDEQLNRFKSENGQSDMEKTLTEIADFMVKNNIIEQKDADKLMENKLIDGSFMEKAAEGLE
ncbi:MAG: NrtA/SsuA/CpmA family ABC transporter substrate-binding protein [Eubacterium sp.]|nr:NrtA/SsuA/CpmA family ABC transporter substrate-binding protein [Eubacterium sp.]